MNHTYDNSTQKCATHILGTQRKRETRQYRQADRQTRQSRVYLTDNTEAMPVKTYNKTYHEQ